MLTEIPTWTRYRLYLWKAVMLSGIVLLIGSMALLRFGKARPNYPLNYYRVTLAASGDAIVSKRNGEPDKTYPRGAALSSGESWVIDAEVKVERFLPVRGGNTQGSLNQVDQAGTVRSVDVSLLAHRDSLGHEPGSFSHDFTMYSWPFKPVGLDKILAGRTSIPTVGDEKELPSAVREAIMPALVAELEYLSEDPTIGAHVRAGGLARAPVSFWGTPQSYVMCWWIGLMLMLAGSIAPIIEVKRLSGRLRRLSRETLES